MKKIVILFFLIVISMQFIYAEENLTQKQKASLCINESNLTLQTLSKEGFSVERVNDTLNNMIALYDAQLVIEAKKQKTDFNQILTYCEDIKKINTLAFNSRDEILALKRFYDESKEGLNQTNIQSLIDEMDREMNNERYEKIQPLIDKTYQTIINEKSSRTALNIFYESTTRGFKKFMDRNWKLILGLIIFLIIVLLIYKNAISLYLIRKKISNLDLRRKSLQNIIMQTQKDYFQYGKISDSTFTIKTKKLAEFIRDIDSQIPLLQEKLAKLNKKMKKDESTTIQYFK